VVSGFWFIVRGGIFDAFAEIFTIVDYHELEITINNRATDNITSNTNSAR
jgi:hypothetical protein